MALPFVTGGGGGAGAVGAFCASGPWGWAVCGGAAVVAVVIVAYNCVGNDDDVVVLQASEHTKGKRGSTKGKHEAGQGRKGTDYGGEKGDGARRPPRRPPDGKTPKGGWPPKK